VRSVETGASATTDDALARRSAERSYCRDAVRLRVEGHAAAIDEVCGRTIKPHAHLPFGLLTPFSCGA
jgi:hypothetical protein